MITLPHRRKYFRAGGIIDLPNLELFNDAAYSFTDAGVTPAGDGDSVYRVLDRGPNSHHLDQAVSGERPTYETDDGYPVIRGDGSSILAAGDVLDSVIAGSDKKWSLSINIDNFSLTGFAILFAKYASLSNQRAYEMDLFEGKLRFLIFNLSSSFVRIIETDSQISTGQNIITFDYHGDIDTNDGLDRVSIRVNKLEVASSLTTAAGLLFDIPATTAQVTTLGRYETVPASSPLYGIAYDFGKIVMLSNPTVQDIDVVENELSDDWGI